MKKNILAAILMLFAVSAMAEDKEIDNGYRWWAQAHFTAGYNANENMRYMSFGKGIGVGGDLSVGYNINDYWGVFLELGYYANKGANEVGPYAIAPYEQQFENFKFNSIEPTLNMSYNLTNGFLGFKPNRHNALYLHAGIGAAFSSGNTATDIDPNWDKNIYLNRIDNANHTVMKGSLGLNYVYMFNNCIAFTADATAHVLGDNHNGGDWQVPVDGRFNIGVGVRVYLSKNKKPSRTFEYVDQVNTVTDTITVVEKVEVNDQDVYPFFFDVNAAELNASQNASIAKIIDKLQKNPSKVIYVLGYADKATEDKNNAELAKSRADAITAQLINAGINKERIVTHDMGDHVQPFLNLTSKNRATICIITDLKHQ